MPTIAFFYGITITMYWSDHGLPHLHAAYEGQEAVLAIEDGRILAGAMRARTARLVQDWIAQRRPELMENWRRSQDLLPFERVAGPDDE